MIRESNVTTPAGRITWMLVALALPLVVSACRPAAQKPAVAIRLVDFFDAEAVSGGTGKPPLIPERTEWRFDGAPPSPSSEKLAATRGWEAGPGVAGLGVQGGMLVGRTTSNIPILHVARTSGFESLDQLHSIEVRIRVSAGSNLLVETAAEEKVSLVDVERYARALDWEIKSPLRPGEEMQTYVLVKPRPLPASQIRHVFIRPSDVGGATFAIESVRLIFRREHLAAIPSGVGFQGMTEIYRESLVARSPETVDLLVELPANPWLDLSVGIVDDRPVTFRAAIKRKQAGVAEAAETLLERTVTTPYRWEHTPIDLSRFAGESVTLALSLSADHEGAIGIWGSPVVRERRSIEVDSTNRAEAGPQAVPRGVIVIWTDTLRADHLDAYQYGRPTAPSIRRLGSEGTLFKNCVTQATWTKVSTPSMMTSLYPSSHGVKEFSDRLPASAMTLAEVYRAAGYATVSFAGNLFTGQFTNLHQGFEEVHEDGSLKNPLSSKTAREYVDRLNSWLESHRDGPFFVFLHLYDPHDPYQPYAPYDTLWADPKQADKHKRQVENVKKVITDPLAKVFGMPTRDELLKAGINPATYIEHDQGWYDGSIRGMDVEVGRLLEKLRSLGLERDTLVVFTADHGEEFLDHGRTFHGQGVYGELTHVPLIVRWPGGLRRGAVVDEVVESIDLMPTLLEASRLPHPPGLQGQSFLSLLRDRPPDGTGASESIWKRRPAVSEKAATKHVGAPFPASTEAYAIVDAGWKLIHNRARPAGGPEFELYDFARDPLNKLDVAGQHPDDVARLAKALEGWHRMVEATRLKPDEEATKGLSQEQLERLRSLGYVK